MVMMQSQFKGQPYKTCRIIFQVLAIDLLANGLTCCANDAILTTVSTNRARTLRSRKTELNLPISTPHFGGCFDSDKGQITCTIDPICPPNTQYLKPSEHDVPDCNSPHHVEIGRCASSASDLESKVGSCAPSRTSCNDTSLYIEPNDTCSIVKDKHVFNSDKTNYPYCRGKANNPEREDRCVLSQDECIDGREDFVSIGEPPRSEPCFCDDVPTGMCYSPSSDGVIMAATSFCAVAAYDCLHGHIFMPAYELSTIINPPRVCRLCEKEDDDIYELRTQGGTIQNYENQISFISTPNSDLINGDHNGAILDYEYDDYDDYDNGFEYDDSTDRLTTGLILGGSLGGFFFTSGAVFFYKRRPSPAFDAIDTSLDMSEGTFI